MIEIQVNNTVVDLNSIEEIKLEVFNTTGMEIQLAAGQVIPAVELDVGVQGPQGIKGDQGVKGDALVYSALTPEEKSEVIAQFDSTVGATSYANIFLNAYLS